MLASITNQTWNPATFLTINIHSWPLESLNILSMWWDSSSFYIDLSPLPQTLFHPLFQRFLEALSEKAKASISGKL